MERLLTGLWQDQLGADKFSALISRIVVSQIMRMFVDEILSSVCQSTSFLISRNSF